jgi:mannan endo-1,4-beta-mannosidase
VKSSPSPALVLATLFLCCTRSSAPPVEPSALPEATGGPAAEASQVPHAERPSDSFVEVQGQEFSLGGRPYCFVGVNFWYGAYLGADAPLGDVARLRAELDTLKGLGVTNLRILGSSESGPMAHSIKPAFRGPGSDYNEALLVGLDRLLSEMATRQMKAVIYLNNFWEWSGGMGTYLSWVNGGEFVDLGDPRKPWPAYPLFTMQFYESEAANALFRDYIRAVVTRVNTVTGRPYRDDSTIMAWQLANEPRPGSSTGPGGNVFPAYYRWIDTTAQFIKALDSRHLVSTGSEGLMGCVQHEPCYLSAHSSPAVDYLTVHLWPKNWGWLKDDDMPGTIENSVTRASEYVAQHVSLAEKLGKPMVLEEFGLPRDGASLEPESPVSHRDRFYAHVLDRVQESALAGGPLVGSNVWSWGGRGRAAHPGGVWRDGDTGYTGDPPQEPQGLNSIFDADTSTLSVLRTHAQVLE